jgi:transposase InsO family protein
MGLSRSTYYDVPSLPTDDAMLVATMIAICDEFEAYGYRRVGAELRHRGIVVNSKKVRRLMRENDLQPKRRRRFVATTDSNHDGLIFPDLARHRGFSTARTKSGWRTSPTSRSPPPSSIWPPSSMLGHAGWSDMRSAAQLMRACSCCAEGGHPSPAATEGLHSPLGSRFAICL